MRLTWPGYNNIMRYMYNTLIRAVRSILIIPLVAILITMPVSAAEETKRPFGPTLEKGIGQYKHENYDEAIVTLTKARKEEPQSTFAAYYLGISYKKIQDYCAAIQNLKDAVTNTPKIKEALLELIDCLYQLNDLEEAKKWVAEAEAEGIKPAQTAFFKGLILTKDDQPEQAVVSFESAKKLDQAMAQSADYQIGVANLKMKKFDDAKKVFQQVVIVNPTSTMANYANEYIGTLERKKAAEKPFRFEAGVAWQYDDNVLLMPDQDSVVSNISDKGDSREVTTAKAEYNQRYNERFGLNAQYLFYWAKQNNLGFYDTLTNTFLVQPNVYFKDSMLGFPCGYYHALVNDKAYLSQPTAAVLYNYMVTKADMCQALIRYSYKDYLWNPVIPAEDRDSNDMGGSYSWYHFYAANKGFVNLRYTLNKEETKGSNWDYVGNRFTAAVLVPVTDKLNVTVSGDLFAQNFLNTHTYYQVYRRDRTYTLSAIAAYKVYGDSEVQLQYTHVKDDSNCAVYEYSRNIYSAGVLVRF